MTMSFPTSHLFERMRRQPRRAWSNSDRACRWVLLTPINEALELPSITLADWRDRSTNVKLVPADVLWLSAGLVRMDIARTLADAGFLVHEAEIAAAAIAILAEHEENATG